MFQVTCLTSNDELAIPNYGEIPLKMRACKVQVGIALEDSQIRLQQPGHWDQHGKNGTKEQWHGWCADQLLLRSCIQSLPKLGEIWAKGFEKGAGEHGSTLLRRASNIHVDATCSSYLPRYLLG